jgi:hypothetical protein
MLSAIALVAPSSSVLWNSHAPWANWRTTYPSAALPSLSTCGCSRTPALYPTARKELVAYTRSTRPALKRCATISTASGRMLSVRSRSSRRDHARADKRNERRKKSHECVTDHYWHWVWRPRRRPDPKEHRRRDIRTARLPGLHRRNEHLMAAGHSPHRQGRREDRRDRAIRRRPLVRARRRRERMRLGSTDLRHASRPDSASVTRCGRRRRDGIDTGTRIGTRGRDVQITKFEPATLTSMCHSSLSGTGRRQRFHLYQSSTRFEGPVAVSD